MQTRKRVKELEENKKSGQYANQEAAAGIPSSRKRVKQEKTELSYLWSLLPFDVVLRILSCFEIEDLIRSCLLVCKQWKDVILSSQSFARLQYKQTLWGIVHVPYPKKRLVFENGPYKILNVAVEQDELVNSYDKGIVCIRKLDDYIRVGNPIKNEWKVFSYPSKGSYLAGMSVDTSTSPASFKILAMSYSLANGTLLQRVSTVRAEIFDSKIGAWKPGGMFSMDGPFQDKLEASLIVCETRLQKRIVTYDFDQGRWSVQGYVSPENNAREEVVLCRGDPILISRSCPWVKLWKEKSCCKGIINWSLMTKLDIRAFLAQHKLKIKVVRHISEHSYCWGHVITVMVWLPCMKSAFLDYDRRTGRWKLGGSMNQIGGNRMGFTPSLITI